MSTILFLIACLIVWFVIQIGKAISHLLIGIQYQHYQLGFSPTFFEVNLFKVRLSIGIIIPLPWLFKIYEIHEDKKQIPRPIWRRRDLPWLKRFAGVLGPIAFLYIISLLVYAVSFHDKTNTYLSMNDVNKNGIYADSLGIELGFETGDKILKVNGDSIEKFADLMHKLYSKEIELLTLDRNGTNIEVQLDQELYLKTYPTFDDPIISTVFATYPLQIGSVIDNNGAFHAGIQADDKIISLNGDTIFYLRDFQKVLAQKSNDSVLLGIQRKAQTELLYLQVHTDENGMIGVIFEQNLAYTTEKKTWMTSLNSGNVFIWKYLKQFKREFVKEDEITSLGGFGEIGRIYAPVSFWKRTSILMLILVCWSFIPTPLTQGRFIVSLILDKFVKLPKSAPKWIGWTFIGCTLLVMIILNAIAIMKFIN